MTNFILDDESTETKQDDLITELKLKADLTETQPVSAAALPLPSGAATSAKQDTLLAELQGKADLDETQPISAAALPLPSGASTSTIQTNGTQQTKITDGTDIADVVTAADDDTDIDGAKGLVTSAILYGRIDADTIKPLRIDASTHSIQTVTYEHHEIHSNSHYFVEDFAIDFDAAETLDFCFTTNDSASWVHLLFSFECTGACQVDIYEGSDFDADGALVVQRANNRAKTYTGTHDGGDNDATVMTDSNAAFTVDALIGWKIYNVTDGSYGIVTDNDETSVTVAALIGGTDDDWDDDDTYEVNRSLSIVTAGATINDLGHRIAGMYGGDATSPARGVPGGGTRESELVLRQNTKYIFRFTGKVNDSILAYNGKWYEHTDKN